MPLNHTAKGFTLLEILLVVVIVSIMTTLGVNIINSQSIERVILNQAQQLNDDLNFICEKAVLENQAFGLELHANGYQALRYQHPDWMLIESQVSPHINESITTDLLLDGLSQQLTPEVSVATDHLPHIICQSDGSFNTFELRFSAADALSQTPSTETYYALISDSPWQLNGAWHQP